MVLFSTAPFMVRISYKELPGYPQFLNIFGCILVKRMQVKGTLAYFEKAVSFTRCIAKRGINLVQENRDIFINGNIYQIIDGFYP